MLLLIDKMSWHYRKTTITFVRESIRFREFEVRTARNKVSFFLFHELNREQNVIAFKKFILFN